MDRLKARENSNYLLLSKEFEGLNDRHDWLDFVAGGMYYGQCVDGVRDGYGLLYCKNSEGDQILYECYWENGLPTNGKLLMVSDCKWWSYEGHLDDKYLPTVKGTSSNEDGDKYSGDFKRGNRHGQGKYQWKDGQMYEGKWEDDKKHGSGRQTFADGSYSVGEYREDEEVGVHRIYSKEGKLDMRMDYDKVVQDV
ncbi:hypothetical protein FGO68_gene4984 [Halteria grandinella]|uniref:Uncharacterized protein n=1 Tax=Halteria grandinella TaxID=5974 RepID=A0A8J8ND51_HALGN|nr:hypothetical protein FGO68_gene4984 [Halteria grandinella]